MSEGQGGATPSPTPHYFAYETNFHYESKLLLCLKLQNQEKNQFQALNSFKFQE
jgi:hypothetical protein